ncbi:MAG: DNA methyltransferase, partial [Candidatus Acidiferrales bacterium]
SEQINSQINKGFTNTLLHGNCVELLSGMSSGAADFVLTDPPYLVNYSSRDGRIVPNDDNDAWLKPAFREIYRVLRWNRFCVSFYAWNRADKFIAAWRDAGFHIAGHLTFIKKYASRKRFLAYAHENAYLLAKGSPSVPTQPIPDVIEWQYTGNKLHPTQKPVSALQPLVRSFSQLGDLVLDPFCGSGSTLLAAKIEGRDFLGIELNPQYFETARERLCPAPV